MISLCIFIINSVELMNIRKNKHFVILNTNTDNFNKLFLKP